MYVKKIEGVIVSAARAPLGDTTELIDEDDEGLRAFIIAKAAPVAALPIQVSATQIIRALNELNLLASVDTAVAAADPMTQRLWARAATFSRDDPMVNAIATALSKTPEELDAVFTLATTK